MMLQLINAIERESSSLNQFLHLVLDSFDLKTTHNSPINNLITEMRKWKDQINNNVQNTKEL